MQEPPQADFAIPDVDELKRATTPSAAPEAPAGPPSPVGAVLERQRDA